MTPPPEQISPSVAVWARTDRGRTGRFLGWGSVLRPDVVVLHPGASAQVVVGSIPTTRVRVRLSDLTGVDVIDGTVVSARSALARGLVAVNLDFATRCAVTLHPLPIRPTAQDVEALLTAVVRAAEADPARPPTRPTATGHWPPGTHPGLTPPWCAIWPGAWGCD